jgi:hypothetical protein
MPHQPSPQRACADAVVQRVVLAHVLAVHPVCCTIPELAREIECGDAVERAVRDLVSVGLLECLGVSLKPTPALIRFNRLDLP